MPDPIDPVDPILPVSDGKEKPEDRKVSFESHQKLLDEKKKVAAELATYKAAEEARKTKELEDQGKYKEMLEERDKALEEANSKLTLMTQRDQDRTKLSRLLSAIDGDVDPKFYKYIDQIDDIIIDPATGEVDAMSVTKAAQKFRAEYPEFIKTKKSGLPNEAPAGGSATKISRMEWEKLSSKDMKKWKPGQIVD